MTRLVTLPHLQTSAVSPGSWAVTAGGYAGPAPELLKGWDYDTPLRFTSYAEVNLDQVRQECALSSDADIVLAVLWWASSTNKRRIAAMEPISQSGNIEVSFEIPPGQVGGSLTVWRQLILVDNPSPQSPFAARLPGSLLWEEDRREATTVILEGDAARFPTVVVDFSKPPVMEPAAAWWLDVRLQDLDASPLACLRLLVNGEHPVIRSFMAGRTDPASKLAASTMTWDVGRKMINAALDSDEFIDGWGGFRPGSLGEVLELLVRKLWPGQDAAGLRSYRENDRGLFEARLQGRLEILGASS